MNEQQTISTVGRQAADGATTAAASVVHDGPRERILQLGEPRLGDAECVALVLRTGCRGAPAEQLATRLLRRFGGIPGLAAASLRQIGRAHV